jgi:TonB family protein
MMNPNESNEKDLFSTGTSISDSVPWYLSIFRQWRQKREERNAPHVDITAKPDPTALDKFVAAESPWRRALFMFLPFLSLITAMRERSAYRHRTIEMTAQPIEVEELWSKSKAGYSGMVSAGLHILFIAAIVIPSLIVLQTPPMTTTSVMLLDKPLVLNLPKLAASSGGGGGGGMKTPTPPSKGQLPKADDKQFVPPMVEVKNLAPELAVEPTVVAPQLAHLIPLPNVPFGDPNGVVGPPSAGPGSGGGIGTGQGTGVGSGKGPGVGPGEGGGFGGGVFQVGGGVTEPVLLSQVQPEYSDDGRKARIQGTVELLIVVNADGSVRFDNVRKSLGYGLDQKAIDAVKKWKFIAGKKDGKPVATYVSVLVNFSLR